MKEIDYKEWIKLLETPSKPAGKFIIHTGALGMEMWNKVLKGKDFDEYRKHYTELLKKEKY